MICEKCYGRGSICDGYLSCLFESTVMLPCHACGGSGVAYCCEVATDRNDYHQPFSLMKSKKG